MNTSNDTFYGIDRAVIEAATRKARRERSVAIHALLGRLFSSVHDDREDDRTATPPAAVAGCTR